MRGKFGLLTANNLLDRCPPRLLCTNSQGQGGPFHRKDTRDGPFHRRENVLHCIKGLLLLAALIKDFSQKNRFGNLLL